MSERLTPPVSPAAPGRGRGAAYRALLRRAMARHVLLYFVPLLLLTLFFHIQYGIVARDDAERQREAMVAHQATMLEAFLGDRLLNLTGLTDRPQALLTPSAPELEISLQQLRAVSEAFVDLAVLDSTGRVLAYAGPLPELAGRNYREQEWFTRLLTGNAFHVITDTYPGFRNDPHFTMALKLEPRGQVRILRAAISPVVTAAYLADLEQGTAVPHDAGLLADIATNLWLVTATFCLLGGLLLWVQARWVAIRQFEALRTEQELNRQLLHAARLATVGEITAGIAHEVNNPLAVVAEKAGLMRDLLDTRFARTPAPGELVGHLAGIEAAAFRASAITQRLLGFVRAGEVQLVPCDLHALADDVVDSLLKSVLAEAGAVVRRQYDPQLPVPRSDPEGLRQVLLNLLKNAADAIGRGGEIVLTTRHRGRFVELEVADNGVGMSPEQLDRVFLPFFTTKAPGVGTGLGLSVSYGIVTGLGGRLAVASEPGRGSVFTLTLPLEGDHDG